MYIVLISFIFRGFIFFQLWSSKIVVVSHVEPRIVCSRIQRYRMYKTFIYDFLFPSIFVKPERHLLAEYIDLVREWNAVVIVYSGYCFLLYSFWFTLYLHFVLVFLPSGLFFHSHLRHFFWLLLVFHLWLCTCVFIAHVCAYMLTCIHRHTHINTHTHTHLQAYTL